MYPCHEASDSQDAIGPYTTPSCRRWGWYTAVRILQSYSCSLRSLSGVVGLVVSYFPLPTLQATKAARVVREEEEEDCTAGNSYRYPNRC